MYLALGTRQGTLRGGGSEGESAIERATVGVVLEVGVYLMPMLGQLSALSSPNLALAFQMSDREFVVTC